MSLILIIAALVFAVIVILAVWWLLASGDDTEREKQLLDRAEHEFGGTDSGALDRLYRAIHRRACAMRRLGRVDETVMHDMLLVFNLRNHALEVELERDSTFTITEEGHHADR
jgi:nitrogen fixation-related uncharacterized protein